MQWELNYSLGIETRLICRTGKEREKMSHGIFCYKYPVVKLPFVSGVRVILYPDDPEIMEEANIS